MSATFPADVSIRAPSVVLYDSLRTIDGWKLYFMGVPIVDSMPVANYWVRKVVSLGMSTVAFVLVSLGMAALYMIDGENPKGAIQPFSNWWPAILPLTLVVLAQARAVYLDAPTKRVVELVDAVAQCVDAVEAYGRDENGVLPVVDNVKGEGMRAKIESVRDWAVKSMWMAIVSGVLVGVPIQGTFITFPGMVNINARWDLGLSEGEMYAIVFVTTFVAIYMNAPDRQSMLTADVTSKVLASAMHEFAHRIELCIRSGKGFVEQEVLKVHLSLHDACEAWSRAMGTTMLIRVVSVAVFVVAIVPLFFASSPQYNIAIGIMGVGTFASFGEQFTPLLAINIAAKDLETAVARSRIFAIQTPLSHTHALAADAYVQLLRSDPLVVRAGGIRLDRTRASALMTITYSLAALFLRDAL